MTESHKDEGVAASGSVDSEQAHETSSGETERPPAAPVVGPDRGAFDATVIVHRPGTQPPDISDIVDTSDDGPSTPTEDATDAPIDPVDGDDADSGTGTPGDGAGATSDDSSAVDLSQLPPPVLDTETLDEITDGDRPSAAAGLDARTVEMPAGGMAAFLEATGFTSPVPADAAPPNTPPRNTPPPDAAPPHTGPPGAVPTDGGANDADRPDATPPQADPATLPMIDDIAGLTGGLDDDPVSVDGNPTTLLPAVDPTAPPPGPIDPTTAVDPADFDQSSVDLPPPTAGPFPPPGGQPSTAAINDTDVDDTNPLATDAPPPPPGADDPDPGHTVIATPASPPAPGPTGPEAGTEPEPHEPPGPPRGTPVAGQAPPDTADSGITVAAVTASDVATPDPSPVDEAAPDVAEPTMVAGGGPGLGQTPAEAEPLAGADRTIEMSAVDPSIRPRADGGPGPEATVVADPHQLPQTETAADPTMVVEPGSPLAGFGFDRETPGGGDESEPGLIGAPSIGAPRTKRRRGPLVAVAIVLLLLAVLVGAWLFDSARTDGQVARGTMLGTTPIGGLDADELEALAGELDAGLAQTTVELTVGDQVVERNAAELGARIDRQHLTETALDARQGGSPALAPIRWLSTFITEERIEPRYEVDTTATAAAIDDLNTTVLPQATEPDLTLTNDSFSVIDGQPGSRVEAEQIAEALPAELSGDAPYTLEVTPLDSAPRFTNDEIAAVAEEITSATVGEVSFQVLDQMAKIPASELRSWVVLDTEGEQPDWRIDEIVALDELRPLFPSLGAEDQQARFSVIDGEPIIIPASETVICCTTESLGQIRQQLDEPLPPVEASEDDTDDEQPQPVRVITVEPEVVGSDAGVRELESLGIVEEVSTFTTEHACCQNRVTNIQRFADLTRGVIIRPGEDFSLNEHVGRRTIEKGFVADGAIVNGILEPQVGGGVSQFATTFFNAAFYAGLDFNEYQSHSLYISRYPRGREATISFPRPDLSVKNTTDYGILVWTDYTPTSITVTFYSTKHIEVEDLPLIRGSRGECSVFTTPRVRTYPDGEVVEDSVFAVYRPGEGFDCNGNSTRPPEDPEGPTATPEPQPAPAPAPAPEPAPQPVPGPVPGPGPGPDPEPEVGTDPDPTPPPEG